jgi:glycosyltransferase involved in cell wall biosynthesis
MEVCALIPVYNEAPHLHDVIKGCLKHVKAVFVVDDGSTDGSGEIAKKAGAIVLRHSINRGKGVALKTGFRGILQEGKWDAVIVLDGDGQHNWDEIPMFISHSLEGGYDVVVGNRMRDIRSMPLERTTTNWLSSFILSALTRQEIKDSQCGFRLVKTDALNRLVLRTRKYDTESEMLVEAARKGFRIGNVPIATIYGDERSYIHPVLDTLRFVRVALKCAFRGKGGGKTAAPEREERC